jgi:hypothetical protein
MSVDILHDLTAQQQLRFSRHIKKAELNLQQLCYTVRLTLPPEDPGAMLSPWPAALLLLPLLLPRPLPPLALLPLLPPATLELSLSLPLPLSLPLSMPRLPPLGIPLPVPQPLSPLLPLLLSAPLPESQLLPLLPSWGLSGLLPPAAATAATGASLWRCCCSCHGKATLPALVLFKLLDAVTGRVTAVLCTCAACLARRQLTPLLRMSSHGTALRLLGC